MANNGLTLRRSVNVFCLVAASVTLLAALGPGWAAVPSSVIKDWRDKAPEVVEITALSVQTSSVTRASQMCRRPQRR